MTILVDDSQDLVATVSCSVSASGGSLPAGAYLTPDSSGCYIVPDGPGYYSQS